LARKKERLKEEKIGVKNKKKMYSEEKEGGQPVEKKAGNSLISHAM